MKKNTSSLSSARLGHEDRAALNALLVKGQLDTARCVERLILDGETVLVVTITAGKVVIDLVPPRIGSPLWSDAAVRRLTPVVVDFVASRFGCEIRWSLPRAAAELQRIEAAARGVH